MHKHDGSKSEHIRQLLDELNEWEQKYGIRYAGDPRLKSTGESNARIEDLKDQLTGLGARFHWNGTEYVLDPGAPARPRDEDQTQPQPEEDDDA
jgi:hypothetical protein